MLNKTALGFAAALLAASLAMPAYADSDDGGHGDNDGGAGQSDGGGASGGSGGDNDGGGYDGDSHDNGGSDDHAGYDGDRDHDRDGRGDHERSSRRDHDHDSKRSSGRYARTNSDDGRSHGTKANRFDRNYVSSQRNSATRM